MKPRDDAEALEWEQSPEAQVERHTMQAEREIERLTIPRLAVEVTAGLFTNGAGDRADRLVLMGANGRDLGGWCFGAVRDQIEAALARAAREAKEEKHD